MSTVQSVRNTVTSGLSLFLDPANPRFYTPTGSTILDISSSSNVGTLANGTLYNSSNTGNFFFDATDDYINLTNYFRIRNFIISFLKLLRIMFYILFFYLIVFFI